MKYKNLNFLKTEISKLIILKSEKLTKIKELELSILKANHFNEIPPDTSNFKDEKIIKYIEKKESLIKEIKKIDNRINQLNYQINTITNTINDMPDCMLKTVLDMFYIKNSKIESIAFTTGYSRSSIYSLMKLKGGE